MKQSSTGQTRPPQVGAEFWTPSQRAVLIALLGALLLYFVIRLLLNPAYVADPQPLAAPRAGEIEDRIDPNTADWSTLAALPMIGETRAREIVAYREQFLARHPGPAFARPTDLLRIRGIGMAMLSQIEPYLRFTSALPATTGST